MHQHRAKHGIVCFQLSESVNKCTVSHRVKHWSKGQRCFTDYLVQFSGIPVSPFPSLVTFSILSRASLMPDRLGFRALWATPWLPDRGQVSPLLWASVVKWRWNWHRVCRSLGGLNEIVHVKHNSTCHVLCSDELGSLVKVGGEPRSSIRKQACRAWHFPHMTGSSLPSFLPVISILGVRSSPKPHPRPEWYPQDKKEGHLSTEYKKWEIWISNQDLPSRISKDSGESCLKIDALAGPFPLSSRSVVLVSLVGLPEKMQVSS